jgi:hypothetical protein
MGELRRPAQMGEGFRTYSTAHTLRIPIDITNRSS